MSAITVSYHLGPEAVLLSIVPLRRDGELMWHNAACSQCVSIDSEIGTRKARNSELLETSVFTLLSFRAEICQLHFGGT